MEADGVILNYLWRLEGIVCGKVDRKEEDPSLVWTISLLEEGKKKIRRKTNFILALPSKILAENLYFLIDKNQNRLQRRKYLQVPLLSPASETLRSTEHSNINSTYKGYSVNK